MDFSIQANIFTKHLTNLIPNKETFGKQQLKTGLRC